MKYIYIIFFIFFLSSCATWKNELRTASNSENIIYNSIIDFHNTSSLAKKSNSFALIIKDYNNDIIRVGIYEASQKFYRTHEKLLTTLPTRYIEYDNKIFYWWDDSLSATDEIINKLKKYNLIYNVNSFADIVVVIEDDKKGKVYYFCKNNIEKYKKIKAGRFVKKTIPLKLKCK